MDREFSRRLAIILCPLLAIGKGFREWGGGGYLPFVLIDYVAILMLAAGIWMARPLRGGNPALLCAGWGFTVAMAYMSFFNRVRQPGPEHGAIPNTALTLLIGALLAVAILGLATSVREPRSTARPSLLS